LSLLTLFAPFATEKNDPFIGTPLYSNSFVMFAQPERLRAIAGANACSEIIAVQQPAN
jgi:hypothetical protein